MNVTCDTCGKTAPGTRLEPPTDWAVYVDGEAEQEGELVVASCTCSLECMVARAKAISEMLSDIRDVGHEDL